jgi:hypothetical protein
MERSSKRGKIPQQDWPSIIARYDAGETLASIARTYGCSPPAISYILSRNRARAAATATAAAPPAERSTAAPPQGGRPHINAAHPPAPAASAGTAPSSRQGNGASPSQNQVAAGNPNPPQPSAPSGAPGNGAQNGAVRRTLHLSPGHANGPEGNGEALHDQGLDSRSAAREPAIPSLYPQPVRQPTAPAQAPGEGPPVRTVTDPGQPKDGALDRALRERVHAEIEAFLAAFDIALAADTPESRAGLREATDRLLRAGARTRIELERLEARLPRPARDRPSGAPPIWRQR